MGSPKTSRAEVEGEIRYLEVCLLACEPESPWRTRIEERIAECRIKLTTYAAPKPPAKEPPDDSR